MCSFHKIICNKIFCSGKKIFTSWKFTISYELLRAQKWQRVIKKFYKEIATLVANYVAKTLVYQEQNPQKDAHENDLMKKNSFFIISPHLLIPLHI